MIKNSDVIAQTCALLGRQERLAKSRKDWDATEAIFEAFSEIVRLYPERREELFAAHDRGLMIVDSRPHEANNGSS